MTRRNISYFIYSNRFFLIVFLAFFSFCIQRIFLEAHENKEAEEIFSYIFPAEVQVPPVLVSPTPLAKYNYRITSVTLFFKCKSSQPLSPQNFSRTRPRGIPVQEPVIKNPNLPCEYYWFAPTNRQLLSSTEDSFVVKIVGSARNVRPPPVQILKG